MSNFPPRYPDITPHAKPMPSPMNTDTKATSKVIRAP